MNDEDEKNETAVKIRRHINNLNESIMYALFKLQMLKNGLSKDLKELQELKQQLLEIADEKRKQETCQNDELLHSGQELENKRENE